MSTVYEDLRDRAARESIRVAEFNFAGVQELLRDFGAERVRGLADVQLVAYIAKVENIQPPPVVPQTAELPVAFKIGDRVQHIHGSSHGVVTGYTLTYNVKLDNGRAANKEKANSWKLEEKPIPQWRFDMEAAANYVAQTKWNYGPTPFDLGGIRYAK